MVIPVLNIVKILRASKCMQKVEIIVMFITNDKNKNTFIVSTHISILRKVYK